MLDASQFVISEVLVNPHGADAGQEYIEIRSTAGIAETIPAGTYLVGVEGDTFAANPGDVQNIFNLSGLTTGANGILVLLQKGNAYTVDAAASKVANTGSGVGWGNGSTSSLAHKADGVMSDIENTSMTLMLVSATAAPTLTNDIDGNNDGAPDGAAYASWTVLDSIGLLDGQNNDFGYGAINFRNGTAGSSQGTLIDVGFNAGYIARKGAATGASTDDWVAGYVTGTKNNWSLDAAKVSDPSYAGHALSHIGSANPNSTPTLVHSAGAFDEGASRVLTDADLEATDLEQSAAALKFTVSSQPAHGSLQKEGVPLAVGDHFTPADIAAGRISYAHDGSETASDAFDFTVADGAGGSTSGTFAITINPVNDEPTIAANEPTTSLAEGATATITGTYADSEGGVVVISASIGAVVDNGDGTWSWSYDTTDGPEDSQTVTITIDDGQATAQATFSLEVTNAAPSIAANAADVNVNEGETAINSGTFADVAADVVTLTASIGAVVDNGDGTWSWSFATTDGPEETQTVTITADDGVAQSQVTFNLNVFNLSPTISANSADVTVNEGETATNSGTLSDVTADPLALNASIGTVIDNGDGTWSWSYTTADGPDDSRTVTITADDGQVSAQVSFNLTVNNVAPAISADAGLVTVTVGDTATNSGSFGDVAADLVLLTASIGTVTENGNGTWSWSHATTNAGIDTGPVTITATDSDNLLAIVTFDLVVNSPGSGGASIADDGGSAAADIELSAIDGAFAELDSELA